MPVRPISVLMKHPLVKQFDGAIPRRNYGTVTPTRDGYSSAGRYCREYQQTIVVGGRNESAYGTACQQPDGSWEIVD